MNTLNDKLNDSEFKDLLRMKMIFIVRDIMKSLRISKNKARILFIKSETYKKFIERDHGMWMDSEAYIADKFLEEYKTNNLIHSAKYRIAVGALNGHRVTPIITSASGGSLVFEGTRKYAHKKKLKYHG